MIYLIVIYNRILNPSKKSYKKHVVFCERAESGIVDNLNNIQARIQATSILLNIHMSL